MAAVVTKRSLRSRTINVEGMAGEGAGAAMNRQPDRGAVSEALGAGAGAESSGPSTLAPTLNQAHVAACQPVSNERARLREQARKGKLPLRKTPAQLVGDLKSATNDASQVLHQLWPNLLRDSDVNAFVVPDTEDPEQDIYDSQMPGVRDKDLDGLLDLVKHMKHVGSCFEAVVERGSGGQPGKEFCVSLDSDEPEELENEDIGSQPAPPGPGETQPPVEELSEDSGDSMDGEATNVVAATASLLGGGRQLVHKDHVKKLVTAYQKAIVAFTKSKKGVAPSQLIPSKVWQQIYKEYKVEFPASAFKEDSLKDHLRASLKDLNSQKESPGECEEGADPAMDEELLTRLMSCDSWKARNVLQTRMDAMETLSSQKSGQKTNPSTPVGSSTSGQTSSVAPPKAASSGGAIASQIPVKPPTKSQNLKEARQDMAAMLGEFKAMSEDRREDSLGKRRLADGKAALHEAKRQESEERRNTLAQQRVALEEAGKMARINLIKEQKALSLISEEEFKEKCRQVFQL